MTTVGKEKTRETKVEWWNEEGRRLKEIEIEPAIPRKGG
jgi:hypothetical protein